MASKRKRQPKETPNSKRIKSSGSDCLVRRALLEQHYDRVSTLRDHVLAELPASSKVRRKKIASLGLPEPSNDHQVRLVHLLDNALICTSKAVGASASVRWEQWQSFSQQCDESHVNLSGSAPTSKASQSDIVDFVIWQLFSEVKQAGSWPKHLLCDGFRRTGSEDAKACPEIPGIFSLHPNSNAIAIRDDPWPQLLSLLGQAGEKIMIHLLTDCSIFLPTEAGFNNFYQLSGFPFSELPAPGNDAATGQEMQHVERKPSSIALVRSRIFYAKPALTTRGSVRAGFKHIHVLNRCTSRRNASAANRTSSNDDRAAVEQQNEFNTIKLMMYIFPRQFGLHNVFTSKVDTTKTAQKFHDYTVREEEIGPLFQAVSAKPLAPKIPKRLRGLVKPLVRQFQALHDRCSYTELLKHYCPSAPDDNHEHRPTQTPIIATDSNIQVSTVAKQPLVQHSAFPQANVSSLAPQAEESLDIVKMATPVAHVSAFCQATLSRIIPDGFWGDEDTRGHNKSTFLLKVDHFVKLRRFETMTLFEISQGFRIPAIAWLQGPDGKGRKPCQTDTHKRIEIFHEFLYFVFDSLLISLIRSNFYVTESNVHRYQIFFFRHDVWRGVAEPAMDLLKQNMLEELKADAAADILGSRKLGYSQVRLLPKGKKLRPIMNLRRRQMATARSGVLSPSINAVLNPVHTMLKLEKYINPAKLGSTMFSVSDIYDKLKGFRARTQSSGGQFFFAKVDVQAAFDTIPQDSVVELMRSVPSYRSYIVTKHAEVKPGEQTAVKTGKVLNKPIRRWHSTASSAARCNFNFPTQLNNRIARKKRNTLFVNSSVQQKQDARALLKLLDQHVQHNLVKIGKKYYRQKVGIPQGSILSSFLCNYFYADLEARHLGFLDSPDCLLLRLIDDFLLITLDKSKAVRFVETMHQGIPSFGVVVNTSKTLVNFKMAVNGCGLQNVSLRGPFPYCGTLINCQTLEISRDQSRDMGREVFNSLTVDFGRFPGQNFQRKVLNAFKIQSHLMFFDTSHNSIARVCKSLHEAFAETATKMWAYMRCLPTSKQPSGDLITRTIIKVVDVAFLLLTGQSRKSRYPSYKCELRKNQVALIAYAAFFQVVHKKQAKYTKVVSWLREETARLDPLKASSTAI